MLVKTRGIVLSYTRFKESSIIVRILTEKLGLQSYIVNGVRSPKAKKGIAIYQPLTLLEMVVYQKSTQTIGRISELKCPIPFSSIPFDIRKSTIAIFMTEFLSKVLEEGDENPEEFNYIFHSIAYLDAVDANYENFHLSFMLGIAKFMGFEIVDASQSLSEIDLKDNHRSIAGLISALIHNEPVSTSYQTRKDSLQALIKYFQFHLDRNISFKSVSVLNQVFS